MRSENLRRSRDRSVPDTDLEKRGGGGQSPAVVLGVSMRPQVPHSWKLRLLGSLSNDDGDGDENGKEAVGLDW